MLVLKRFSNNKWLTLLVVLLVGLLLFTAYWKFGRQSSTTPTTADGNPVNLSPATPSEQQETDQHKKDLAQDTPDNKPSSSPSQKQLSVVITSASKNGVRGYVNGVFEDGGTCTATATQGSQVVTKTSTGFQNASYTQCAPINWDTELGSGTWSIVLSYKSASGSAQSLPTEVK